MNKIRNDYRHEMKDWKAKASWAS